MTKFPISSCQASKMLFKGGIEMTINLIGLRQLGKELTLQMRLTTYVSVAMINLRSRDIGMQGIAILRHATADKPAHPANTTDQEERPAQDTYRRHACSAACPRTFKCPSAARRRDLTAFKTNGNEFHLDRTNRLVGPTQQRPEGAAAPSSAERARPASAPPRYRADYGLQTCRRGRF